MSALFGLVGTHNESELQAMAAELAHRGPASRVEHLSPRLSVGVIGRDPERMIYRTGKQVIVAAGQIYDTPETVENQSESRPLAPELMNAWHDTGMAGLEKLDGDYAAAICSVGSAEVVFLRDFFGCAPLFWSILNNGCIAFASEYKAIMALGAFSPEVDRPMLQYLQAAKRIPVGRTLLRNILAVRPGATRVGPAGEASDDAFKSLACQITIHDEQTAKRIIGQRFQDTMRRRAGQGGRTGLALSGGIDSIAMAFQLRHILPDEELHTFSAGYGDDDPELEIAAEVAASIQAVHHPVYTPPTLMLTSMRKLVWHMEDPTARSEALQLMLIGEVAAPHVHSLLSGQGADGLFAGMPRHKLIRLAGRLPILRRQLFEIFDLTQFGLPPASPIGKALGAALHRGRVPPVPEIIQGGDMARPARTPAGPQFLNRFLANGFQSSAAQDAAKFERTFGASGVDYIAPCLDVSFARTAFTVDESLKIKNGLEKYIFRSAMSSVVPEKFRSIPKYPQRMRYDVEFADCLDQLAEQYLAPIDVRTRGLFEPGSIERIRRRQSGKPYASEAAMRLWTAVATEIWARLFLDKEKLTP